MSKVYTTKSSLMFYPLPVTHKLRNAIVYTPHKLFETYYNTYTKVIDKKYYLNLYENSSVPEKSSLYEMWGRTEEMEEWARISSICDDNVTGIVFNMFLLGHDPFFFIDDIKEQENRFFNLQYQRDMLWHHNIHLSYKKPIEHWTLLQTITKCGYFYYNWKEIFRWFVDHIPNDGNVYVEDGFVKGLLWDFECVKQGVYRRQTVPLKELQYP